CQRSGARRATGTRLEGGESWNTIDRAVTGPIRRSLCPHRARARAAPQIPRWTPSAWPDAAGPRTATRGAFRVPPIPLAPQRGEGCSVMTSTSPSLVGPGRSAAIDTATGVEIKGAFGSITTEDSGTRRSLSAKLKTLLAIVGPGVIVMVGDNDAGAF